MDSAMEEVAQLCAMKCSAIVDAACDTVSASFVASMVAGDLCATQSLGNDVVSTYESAINAEKKVVCALNQARAIAVCAEDSLASSRQMNKNWQKHSSYRSEDSAVWVDVFLDEELARMFEPQTLGEHRAMYDLDFEEMWDRSM
ncbi:hypothetical protein GUJ93_ZPchr0008g12500 [Zizania palustris]|uniref:Uncharacterized protein n=1 Tax=Zizania palustris TaxID=103762 RepID=A0A8J5RI77_ZIZPA|nr:hypothetical protein GUJ93_ZPchr0008g12500 [Zizania palustris]